MDITLQIEGTIQDAYNESFEYLLDEKKSFCVYVPYSYDNVESFHKLRSEFYFLSALSHYSKDLDKYTSYNMVDRNIFTDKWIVWYRIYTIKYKIILDKKVYHKKLIVNIGIAFGIALLLFLLWKYGRRIELK